MMKNLALAASVMALVALSGQAFARTDAPNARHHRQMTDLSAFNAFDQVTAPSAAESNMHRYEGGPKSNV
jgi:hypothetical protein